MRLQREHLLAWRFTFLSERLAYVNSFREFLTAIRAPNRTLLHEKLSHHRFGIDRLTLLCDWLEPVHMGEKSWPDYVSRATRELDFIAEPFIVEMQELQSLTEIDLTTIKFIDHWSDYKEQEGAIDMDNVKLDAVMRLLEKLQNARQLNRDADSTEFSAWKKELEILLELIYGRAGYSDSKHASKRIEDLDFGNDRHGFGPPDKPKEHLFSADMTTAITIIKQAIRDGLE